MLMNSLLLSGLLLVIFGVGYWFGRRVGRRVLAISLVATVLLPFSTVSLAVFFNWLLVVGVASGCCLARSSTGRFVAWSLAATACAYLLLTVLIFSEYQATGPMRLQYPEQSLRDRLSYEQTASSQRSSAVVTPPSRQYGLNSRIRNSRSPAAENEPPLTLQELAGIDMLEYKFDQELTVDSPADHRERALRSLSKAHQGFVTQFVESPGFGVGRIGRRGNLPALRQYIEIPRLAPIPLPELSAGDSLGSAEQEPWPERPDPAGEVARQSQLAALAELHTDNIVDFSNPIGLGYVPWNRQQGKRGRDLERAVGFEPHGFRKIPELSIAEEADVRWRIQGLHLVSLLKHESPVVYLSKDLPRMEQLRSAPTRPLDRFEVGALEQLQAGEDLVVVERHNHLRMLGSIRAVRQCIACHQVESGELLGAFSYRLLRDPPGIAPPPGAKDGQPLTRRGGSQTHGQDANPRMAHAS